MDEHTNIQTDIHIDGHTQGRTYTRTDIHTDRHTRGRMYRRTDIHMDGHTHVHTDGQLHEQIHGRTDKRTYKIPSPRAPVGAKYQRNFIWHFCSTDKLCIHESLTLQFKSSLLSI